YCHPLTLAARELRGQVPQAIGDPETLEQFGPPHPVRAPPSQEGSQIDVLLRCEVRQQIAVLEDEADAVTTDCGECAVADAGQIGLAQPDLPRRGPVAAGSAVQEGGLAPAGGAHDGGEQRRLQAEAEPDQGAHAASYGSVVTHQFDHLGGRRRAGSTGRRSGIIAHSTHGASLSGPQTVPRRPQERFGARGPRPFGRCCGAIAFDGVTGAMTAPPALMMNSWRIRWRAGGDPSSCLQFWVGRQLEAANCWCWRCCWSSISSWVPA